MRAYATYDPRKGTHVAANGGDHPYQEIPYGDGPGPRGPIPEVPQHYAQVPPPPQRQGMLGSISPLSCAMMEKTWFSPPAGTVAQGCQTLMVGVPWLRPAVLWSLSTTITLASLCVTDLTFAAGGSMPGQDEDISPYATFHLLGMREEVSFNFQRILFAILPSKVTWEGCQNRRTATLLTTIFIYLFSGKEWNGAEWNDDDARDPRPRSKYDSTKHAGSSETARLYLEQKRT